MSIVAEKLSARFGATVGAKYLEGVHDTDPDQQGQNFLMTIPIEGVDTYWFRGLLGKNTPFISNEDATLILVYIQEASGALAFAKNGTTGYFDLVKLMQGNQLLNNLPHYHKRPWAVKPASQTQRALLQKLLGLTDRDPLPTHNSLSYAAVLACILTETKLEGLSDQISTWRATQATRRLSRALPEHLWQEIPFRSKIDSTIAKALEREGLRFTYAADPRNTPDFRLTDYEKVFVAYAPDAAEAETRLRLVSDPNSNDIVWIFDADLVDVVGRLRHELCRADRAARYRRPKSIVLNYNERAQPAA